jgi:hypothetical protein
MAPEEEKISSNVIIVFINGMKKEAKKQTTKSTIQIGY